MHACSPRISRATSSTPSTRGAQPARCLRLPIAPHQASEEGATSEFTASDILDEVARAAPDVGIVDTRAGAAGCAGSHPQADGGGPSGVSGSLGRESRGGAGGHQRGCTAGDTPLQPDAAVAPPRARPGRRGARERRDRRRDHLRRTSRASRDGARSSGRQAALTRDGHHRRHLRCGTSSRCARHSGRPAHHRARRRSLSGRRDAGRRCVDDGRRLPNARGGGGPVAGGRRAGVCDEPGS